MLPFSRDSRFFGREEEDRMEVEVRAGGAGLGGDKAHPPSSIVQVSP